MSPTTLYAWRHPRARGAEGRCIGRTELPVDARKTKRLARRIAMQARRLGLPREVLTSPRHRCRDVGRCLRRLGWRHRVDPMLAELDFGRWDGQPWHAMARQDIDAWTQDFVNHAPGGGESLASLLARVRGFEPGNARVVVTHGGWLSAALWLGQHGLRPPTADAWPAAPATARMVAIAHRG